MQPNATELKVSPLLATPDEANQGHHQGRLAHRVRVIGGPNKATVASFPASPLGVNEAKQGQMGPRINPPSCSIPPRRREPRAFAPSTLNSYVHGQRRPSKRNAAILRTRSNPEDASWAGLFITPRDCCITTRRAPSRATRSSPCQAGRKPSSSIWRAGCATSGAARKGWRTDSCSTTAIC